MIHWTRWAVIGLLSLSALLVRAQEANPKNEIGVDATYLIARFIPNSTGFELSSTALTYRRYFDSFNLRAGLGFQSSNQEYTLEGIDEVFTSNRRFFLASLGIERPIELSERWQTYFGLDIFYSQLDDRGLTIYNFNAGVREEQVVESNQGLSPFLGIRFRINDRVSLFSEANFQLYVTDVKENQRVIYEAEGFSVPIDEDVPSLESMNVAFNAPYTIRIAVSL